MATHSFTFYDGTPSANGFSNSGSFTYTGPATQDGTGEITDNGSGSDGATFTDNDGVTGTFTINGNTSTNVSTEPDEGFLLRDTVTGETFRAMGLDVVGGPASGTYTLSEKPLIPGRSYDVLSFEDDPSASGTGFRYGEFVCYAPGTLILTPTGEIPVEDLRVGDLVMTADHGPQPIRWLGSRTLDFGAAPHKQRPIEIKAGGLGGGLPRRDLYISPQHRMLMRGPVVAEMFGDPEVLALAKGLVGLDYVRVMKGKRKTNYISLLCDRHEVLIAEGAESESMYPGPMALKMVGLKMRHEIQTLFPQLVTDPKTGYGPKARHVLTCKETEALVEALRARGVGGNDTAIARWRRRAEHAKWDEDLARERAEIAAPKRRVGT